MTDLVERLRNAAEAFPENLMAPLLTEAANTLEAAREEREIIGAEAVKYAGKSGRLEAKVDRLAGALNDLLTQLEAIGIYIPGQDNGQWAGTEGLSFSATESVALRDLYQESED